jgi:uncharacterized membrane protein
MFITLRDIHQLFSIVSTRKGVGEYNAGIISNLANIYEDNQKIIMNTALWIVQGLLAAMFGMAAIMKLTQPEGKLGKRFPWATDFSVSTVRFIGLCELLGAIGLIVPWLTGIAPILTPVAALGLCLIMVLATNIVHMKKNQYKEIAFNIILFLFAAFVAYGRFNI